MRGRAALFAGLLVVVAGCGFEAGYSSAGDAAAVVSGDGSRPSSDADPTAPDASETAACDDPGIALCLQFEDTMQDSSATGISATATGVAYADGHDGRALSLDAASKVTLPESTALDVTQMTLEAWVNPTATDGTNIVFDNQNQYALIVRNDMADCVVLGESEFLNPAGGTVPAGEWTHIACTYDSTNGLRVFLNGTQVASAAADGDIRTGGTDGSAVGEDHPDAGSKFVGMIDSLRLWNVARPPGEICPGC